tara:strand:- start:40010 stop:41053 length:1044 start_codon:yes stop_codon:yes gene_type:complete
LNNESPLVSIIIVNYNAGKLLQDCIKSLYCSTHKNLEVIVVDNNSHDNSHKECKNIFPQIKLIENKKNLGYCEGNNVGINIATGKYIVILNPDTIVSTSWLNELLSAESKIGPGLFQPKIMVLKDENRISNRGNMQTIFGFGFAQDRGSLENHNDEKIRKINYATGTCLFTSREILDKIGIFDPFLFLYHDDLDLGWRASQLGVQSYYVPKSKIFHIESYSLQWSSKKFYWLERNRKYCLKTHYSKSTYKKLAFNLLLVDILVFFFYLSKGFVGSKIKADLDIRRNKKFIEEKYNELEKKKIISDEKLIHLFAEEIYLPENVFGNIIYRTYNSILSYLSRRSKKFFQ